MCSVCDACQCLDSFIVTRLANQNLDQWLEQAFVTRLWMTVQDTSMSEDVVLASLQDMLEGMFQSAVL